MYMWKHAYMQVKPTVLHSLNVNVDQINQGELQRLVGTQITYQALDSVRTMRENRPDHYRKLENDKFFKDCLSPENLELRIGAQVLLRGKKKDKLCFGNLYINKNTHGVENRGTGIVT